MVACAAWELGRRLKPTLLEGKGAGPAKNHRDANSTPEASGTKGEGNGGEKEPAGCRRYKGNGDRRIRRAGETPAVRKAEKTTACADSPAQALPRGVVRGQNPNDRSPSDRTASASQNVCPSTPAAPSPLPPSYPRPAGQTDAERSIAELFARYAIKMPRNL